MNKKLMKSCVAVAIFIIYLASLTSAATCPWFLKNELYTAQCGVVKEVPASSGILANDLQAVAVLDPESITIDPKYGTIDVSADGSFTFEPARNIQQGTYVSFKYNATNGVCDAKYPGIAKFQISCKCKPFIEPVDTICLPIALDEIRELLDEAGVGCLGCGDMTIPIDLSDIELDSDGNPIAGTYSFCVKCPGCQLACGEIVIEDCCEPSEEVCDGIDNDCDGAIDNGNPGGDESCDTGLPGECSSGTTACEGGTIICKQDNQPSAEVCDDGLDNDCDGLIDMADSDCLGTGDVQVTLRWSDYADIDLWVTDPFGEKIYYLNPTSASGGHLDVDNRCGNFEWDLPENIFWPTGGAPSGSYTVQVDYYADCGDAGPVDWEVTTLVQGITNTYTGTITYPDEQTVTTFTVV